MYGFWYSLLDCFEEKLTVPQGFARDLWMAVPECLLIQCVNYRRRSPCEGSYTERLDIEQENPNLSLSKYQSSYLICILNVKFGIKG